MSQEKTTVKNSIVTLEKNKWTDEQQLVIDVRNKNMLVAAAAGSGKTAVLVERIITLVTDENSDVDIDRILVVTFTKAAAAEMKDRIRHRLEEMLEANPSDERLLRQSTLIHNARICTIDSFCSYVVKNYFYTLGLDPGFSMASKAQLKTLKNDVMEDIIEKHLQDEDEAFKDLLYAYSSGVSTEGFSKVIIDLWDKASSFPWPNEWLDKSIELYAPSNETELNEVVWVNCLVDDAKAGASDAIALLEKALEICNLPDGPDSCIPIINSDIEIYNKIIETEGLSALQEAYATKQYARWSVKKRADGTEVNPEHKESAKACRDEAKKIFEAAYSDSLNEPVESILAKLELLRVTVDKLIAVAKEYGEELLRAKQKKGIYDFNDIEHFALDILRDKNDTGHTITEVARELADTYMQVMVDEYQDSNDLQEQILTSVCKYEDGKNDYFMVGDVKQSIYSFRRATPQLFMKKSEEYISHKLDYKNADSVRIDLNKNFRSREEVLGITNQIFEIIMQPDMGGVLYDDDAALHRGSLDFEEAKEDCKAELIVIDPAAVSVDAVTGEATAVDGDTALDTDLGDGSDENVFADMSTARIEAGVVAKRITELMSDFTVFDKNNGSRPVRYSDIVILMRSLKNVGQEFVTALREVGIPAYLESENGFFDQPEIRFILNYLWLVDNSYDDISLASVLHSPIYNISNDEMLKVITAYKRTSGRRGRTPFYSAVYNMESPSENLQKFFEDLKVLREMSGYEPVHILFEKIISLTGCKNFYSTIVGGKRRAMNIDKLIDLAVSYENSGDMSVSGFARYVENMILQEEDPGLSSAISENDDVVRIMTIHKSKGLEFPVVFLSQTTHIFNDQDLAQDIIVNDKFGIGIKYRNSETRQKSNTLIHKWIASGVKKQSRGEELRMLYVAMTRAKEKLIITGVLKNGMAGYDKLCEGIYSDTVSLNKRVGARNYLTWIAQSDRAYRNAHGCGFDMDVVFESPAGGVSKTSIDSSDVEKVKGDFEELALQDTAEGKKSFEELKTDLEFAYPYTITSNFKSKYSVSEIKHNAIHELEENNNDGQRIFECPDEEEYVPEFIRKQVVAGGDVVLDAIDENGESDIAIINKSNAPAGTVYGTAVHRFFEMYDFARDDYKTSIKEQYEFMSKAHLLTDEQLAYIKPSRFKKFFESKLAERMHIAATNGKLYREQPFVFGATPKQLGLDENDDTSRVLVQGEIDAFFEEDGKLVLLDYKTDRVDSESDLVARYKVQLMLYKDALNGAYDMPVGEVLIYSMRLGETIDVR